ncbi:hypothetical protein [Bradyrhizobium sp. I71]|uniref:hypothetical protein n=1 Tax=Bradyrhizobium sp. I71 TaxID=2590772 RepID=UPI001EF7D0C8|nr:hypothetical protein [Bradyrhizobium sp. I71]
MISPPRRAATAPNRKRRAASKSESAIDDTGAYPTPRKRTLPHASPSSGSTAPAARLGSLERKAYKEDWWESSRFRRGVRAAEAERDQTERSTAQVPVKTAVIERNASTGKGKTGGGFGALRLAAQRSAFEEGDDADRAETVAAGERRQFPVYPVTPARVAARLILARLVDARPELKEILRSRSPVVAIDVPDPEMLDRVLDTWQRTILDDLTRVHKVNNNVGKRRDSDLLLIVAKEPSKGKAEFEREREALAAVSLALPIAISPAAETHLPKSLKANPTRIAFPPIDATTIARCIRIVTGRTRKDYLDENSSALMTASDLIVAIRFDRTPAECMHELRRHVSEAKSQVRSRHRHGRSAWHGRGSHVGTRAEGGSRRLAPRRPILVISECWCVFRRAPRHRQDPLRADAQYFPVERII